MKKMFLSISSCVEGKIEVGVTNRGASAHITYIRSSLLRVIIIALGRGWSVSVSRWPIVWWLWWETTHWRRIAIEMHQDSFLLPGQTTHQQIWNKQKVQNKRKTIITCFFLDFTFFRFQGYIMPYNFYGIIYTYFKFCTHDNDNIFY